MKRRISFPLRSGKYSKQAHADLPADGTYEREVSREGFYGAASHIHHKHPPTNWSQWDGPLRPRAFNLNKLSLDQPSSPWEAIDILSNDDCKIRLWSCTQTMDYLVRNADGDDLLFVHQGEGDLFCDYGHLNYQSGDYLLIPRSCMWRLAPKTETTLLMVEATNGNYGLPEKGIVGQHAIFDPTALATPEIDELFLQQQNESEWQVKVKRFGHVSTITYPFNPLDAIGWHGDVSVVSINWRDIRPLMSHRYHLPPSAHSTFVADNFVVCTFVPRPMETDPGALKVPFCHSNDDYDEIIFYHAGDFFSRDNIEPGMLTFHPCGFTHGPHPKAYQKGQSNTRKQTDEVAVMIDTRHSMAFSAALNQTELKDYVNSWSNILIESNKDKRDS